MHPIEHLRYIARARGADAGSLVREAAAALASMRFDPAGLVVACRRVVERHPDCAPLWAFSAQMLTDAEPFELAWEIARLGWEDPTAAQLADLLPEEARIVTIGGPVTVADALARRGDVEVLAVESRHRASGFVRQLERVDVRCHPVAAEALSGALATAQLLVLEPLALSPSRALVPMGSAAAVALAQRRRVPVWLVAARGRRIPDPYLGAMFDRLDGAVAVWEAEYEVIDLDASGPAITIDSVIGPGGSITGGRPIAPDCPFAPELLRTSPI